MRASSFGHKSKTERYSTEVVIFVGVGFSLPLGWLRCQKQTTILYILLLNNRNDMFCSAIFIITKYIGPLILTAACSASHVYPDMITVIGMYHELLNFTR